MSIGTQLRAIERGMQLISSYPEWSSTPIIFGESDPEGCAACKGSQNGYRNGPLYGVSVAEATIRTYELARKYGLTVQGAVTWAFEFEDQPPFAGFRELATDGIDKPVLNVFRMLGMLGGDDLKQATWLNTESSGALPLADVVTNGVTGIPDVNAVATRNGSELDILIWNYHDADLPAEPAQVRLEADGLHGAAVMVSEYRMDATHSNAYRAWQQMGSPVQPTPEQKSELEKAGALDQTASGVSLPVHDGKASLELRPVPRQGVVLVRLRER
jgi:xylan 1,4-beta-xylosidase